MAGKTQTGTLVSPLPNSVEAEQNILCCILRDETLQLDIIAQLCAEDFYQTNHQIIFSTMRDIANSSHRVGEESVANTVNLTTVVDALRRNGKLAQVGDVDYIARLHGLLPGTANYDEYLSMVKRSSTMRQLIDICGKVTQKAYNVANADEALHYAEDQIYNLAHQGVANNGLVNLTGVASKALLTINDRFANPDKFRGILTGYERFDRLTNGMHGGELIVLAARPGVGKSALAMNIAENVAKQGKTVAIFSLEMSNLQLVERLMSSMSGVGLKNIKNGELPHGEQDIIRLTNAHNAIANMKLFGNDMANITPSEISSQCRVLRNSDSLDLVVIDYIQLMNSGIDARQGRQVEVSHITRSLKLMAKALNVPVIALSQLKRDAEIRNIAKPGANNAQENDGTPVLSDLRESGAIEQDADIVLFIHKLKTPEYAATHKLVLAKHRNGVTDDNIPLYWQGDVVHFWSKEDALRVNVVSLPQQEFDSQAQEGESLGVDDSEEEFILLDEDDGAQILEDIKNEEE